MASGSGALNDLSIFGGAFGFASPALVWANNGFGSVVISGSGSDNIIYEGAGLIFGPANFGGGGEFAASSGTGDLVGMMASGLYGGGIIVPTGYVDGTALSSSAIWLDQSIAGLGLEAGTYLWTWGGCACDGTPPGGGSFELVIDAPAVPEPASIALLGAGIFGLGVLRRRKAL